jgi:hypothetical protein
MGNLQVGCDAKLYSAEILRNKEGKGKIENRQRFEVETSSAEAEELKPR